MRNPAHCSLKLPNTDDHFAIVFFRNLDSLIHALQVMSVLGGKASCRRKFVLNVELLDQSVGPFGDGFSGAILLPASCGLVCCLMW